MYDMVERNELALKEAFGVDNIETLESYFIREKLENDREQGFDVEELLPERTYSAYERDFHMRNKLSEELESKRADRDPFDMPHLIKEDNDMADVIINRKTKEFISKATYELKIAEMRINNKQVWKDNIRTGEYTRIELTNNDLEMRKIFIIGTKEVIVPNFKMQMGDETPIRVIEGKMELTRDKKIVTITISGDFLVEMQDEEGDFVPVTVEDKKIIRKYEVAENIWLAEEKDDRDKPAIVAQDWTSELI